MSVDVTCSETASASIRFVHPAGRSRSSGAANGQRDHSRYNYTLTSSHDPSSPETAAGTIAPLSRGR